MKSSFHRQLRRVFGYALLMLGFAAYSASEAGASVSSITIDAASGEVFVLLPRPTRCAIPPL